MKEQLVTRFALTLKLEKDRQMLSGDYNGAEPGEL
jgi:hypothetical protein